jgi:DNA-binding transcriptional regulator YiaG
MSDHIRVEGHSYLMRDGQSGAIINTNVNEMTQARIRKAQQKKQQNEIKELRSELQEMKQLLNKMIEVNDGRHNS